jgi:sugar phosphate isomerase/epimerase
MGSKQNQSTKQEDNNVDIISTSAGIVSMDHPRQGLMDIRTAGFENSLLELAEFCSPWELENLGKEQKSGAKMERKQADRIPVSECPSQLEERVRPLAKRYQEAGLQIAAARAPYLLRNTKRKDLEGLLFDLAKESLRFCGSVRCPYLIVRPLSACAGGGDGWRADREFYLGLHETARENRVMILLENQCRDLDGHLVRGSFSDPKEAASFVDGLNEAAGEEGFGFCMDVGTCNLCGQNLQEFILSLGNRIKAVVLKDGDGHREMSLLPFTYSGFERSGLDWLGLVRGLRDIRFDGQLILDFVSTAQAFSPFLRPELLRLAKAVAEYFQWQVGMEQQLRAYPSRVLFGAGNMCRNYMKCYGEQYPPLFTCDNNPDLWGSNFCGLLVKAPESLKELPEECAVIICNIYYREIEEQLRSMGIKNKIEFFSDEFMPSFYFDRLESRR